MLGPGSSSQNHVKIAELLAGVWGLLGIGQTHTQPGARSEVLELGEKQEASSLYLCVGNPKESEVQNW